MDFLRFENNLEIGIEPSRAFDVFIVFHEIEAWWWQIVEEFR